MIAVLMAEGFESVEAICPYDLMRRAGLDVRLVGLKSKTVKGNCEVTVECAMTAKELIESGIKPEMLVLPGGMPGAANIDAAPETDELIRLTDENQGYFAAICAAPMVYGKRGMLRGVKATAFPEFRQYLEGARLADTNVVCDRRFITAAGMGVAFEFGLELLRVFKDKDAVRRLTAAVCAEKK